MKARYPIACERCKKVIHTGTACIRLHGRLWCVPCTAEYLRQRKRAKELAA